MSTLHFVSFVQPATGAAIGSVDAAETDPAAPTSPSPAASVQGTVTVTNKLAPQTDPDRNIHGESGLLKVMGPDAVVGLEPAQVVGRSPSPGATGVEAVTMASIELSATDMPWRFSPASAGPSERLRPWIVLIVVPAEVGVDDDPPRLTVATSELPNLGESWAWAHAQLDGDGSDPRLGRSRLLCPRKLEPNTRWRAALVPAFLGGVRAGLFRDDAVADANEPAWTSAQATVTLPVYDHWEFTTGEDADFEALARRILPARPSELVGFGTRGVDVSQPWPGDAELPGPTAIVQLGGALRPLGDAPDDQLTGEQSDELHRRLAEAVAASALGDLGPPLRGGRHVGRASIVVDGGDWVDQVNRNPARRLAASRGADWVIAHQEELMARAWKQAADIRAAAQRMALGRAALAVNESLQRRHVETLDTDELIALVAPSAKRARIAQSPGAPTLGAVFAASAAPNGATTTALARLTRPASRVGRALAGTRPVTRALAGRVPSVAPDLDMIALAGAGEQPARESPAPEGSFAALLAERTDAARVSAIATAATAVWLAQQATVGAAGDTLMQVSTLASSAVFSAGPASVAAAIQSAESSAAMLTAIGHDRLGVPTLTAVGSVVATTEVTVAADGLHVTPAKVAAVLLPAADAASALRRRIAATVSGGGRRAPVDGAPDLDPVLLTPDVATPMALALVERDPEWFVPGLGTFPPDRSTLLAPDSSFAEAVLVGANTELLGEMVWREFPTDQRGTPIRRFWPRPDRGPDIEPIHRWRDNLGTHMDIDHANTSMILIRAELLHRYPSTVILATPASVKLDTNPRQLVPSGQPTQWMEPIFTVPIDGSTRALAFAIPSAKLREPVTVERPGWFFVFIEPPHRLRFGFDLDGPPQPSTSDEVAWPHVLDPARPFAVATKDLGLPADAGRPVWGGAGACAADVARVTAQKPVRLALHSSRMVESSG